MIIYDFHIEGITILPFKTDTPSFVNADAVLPYPVSLQVFQTICRWDAQVAQSHSPIQHPEFAQGNLLNIVR